MNDTPLNMNENRKSTSAIRLTVRPKEAAKALGISDRTLFNLRKSGKIESFKIDRAVLIPISSLENYVAQRAQTN